MGFFFSSQEDVMEDQYLFVYYLGNTFTEAKMNDGRIKKNKRMKKKEWRKREKNRGNREGGERDGETIVLVF